MSPSDEEVKTQFLEAHFFWSKTMQPLISKLEPVPTQALKLPISIKLNTDLVNQLKACLQKGTKAKLIIKDGGFLLRVGELEYPCPALAETSRLDVYDGTNCFKGRIQTRLNVITDAKQIKEYARSATQPSSAKRLTMRELLKEPEFRAPQLASSSVASIAPYAPDCANNTLRFLYFSALGPVTSNTLCRRLLLAPGEILHLLGQYSQPYNPHDLFIADDVYAHDEHGDGDHPTYILKDKSYKEMMPWTWDHYTSDERSIVLHNIQNGLKRLGFLETHPLRRKIIEEPRSVDEGHKKALALGGGLLKQRKSPVKRSLTASLQLLPPHQASAMAGSPIKTESKKRKPAVLSSSSDDEKMVLEKRVPRRAPSAKTRADSNSSSNQSSGMQGAVGLDNNSTSPSSINEEPEESAGTNESKFQKKLQFYNNLATKFKIKHREYEGLYKSLQGRALADKRKHLTRLFELHNQLAEWKRKLWDFDNETKVKLDIMTLNKHKKAATAGSKAAAGAPAAKRQLNPKLPVKPTLYSRSLDY